MALNSNAQYAYGYLQDKYKLSPAQAAGVVGNLYQESNLNTGAVNKGDGQDGTNSIGIAQWNGDRARGLHSFAADNKGDAGSLDTQLDYVMHEMQTKETGAYKNLMNSNDVASATQAVIGYERPQGWSAKDPTAGNGYGNRLKYAGQLVGMSPDEIAKATPTSATAPPASDPTTTASTATATTAPAAADAPAAPQKGIFGLPPIPKIMPDKVMGIDIKKGINAMGAISTAMQKQADTNNATLQQAAQAGQQRRMSAQPIQTTQIPGTPLMGNSPQQSTAGLSPADLDQLKKKLLMSRAGGLGGLGGYGSV